MIKKKGRQSFTLLEIIISIAILSVAAVVISWEMKGVLSANHFQKNIDWLVTDLKKAQILALSDRVDIELKIKKIGDTYSYQLHSDDPIPFFEKKPMKLKGIESIFQKDKSLSSYVFTIYSSGRITPSDPIILAGKDREVMLDLQKTPLIEIKNINPL